MEYKNKIQAGWIDYSDNKNEWRTEYKANEWQTNEWKPASSTRNDQPPAKIPMTTPMENTQPTCAGYQIEEIPQEKSILNESGQIGEQRYPVTAINEGWFPPQSEAQERGWG